MWLNFQPWTQFCTFSTEAAKSLLRIKSMFFTRDGCISHIPGQKHFFPFKSTGGIKIIEGTLVSINPIMWLSGTNIFRTNILRSIFLWLPIKENIFSTKREEKVTRYCDGKGAIYNKLLKNMQCDLSRTTYNTSGENSDKCFKIANLHDNLESVPKLITSWRSSFSVNQR